MKLCLHRKGHLWKDAKPLTEEQQKLVTENIALAYHYCKKKPILGLDADENESEALFCLTRAAGNFNPSLGFKFTTFAWTVWLNHRKDANRETQSLTKGYGVSQTAYHDDNAKMFDPEDRNPGPDEIAERMDEVNSKLSALSILDKRSVGLLKSRASGKTLLEVAKELGITRERVRQIETVAITKVRIASGVDLARNSAYIKFLEKKRLKKIKGTAIWHQKIATIKQARTDHPEWSISKMSKELGISEKMCAKYFDYRGYDIRRMLNRGRTPVQIAEKLGVSFQTVVGIMSKMKKVSA